MFDSVADVIAARFGVDRASITADSSFDDLDLDSLAQIELATAIKKKLGIEIADEEMAEMKNVGAIAARLEEIGQTL